MFVKMLFATCAGGQEMQEYRVKAAFLYNFAKFVEWPPQAFKTPQDPIAICVLEPNPFGTALAELIRGKSIDGRPIVFRIVQEAEEAGACQILFVSASAEKRFRSLEGNLRPAGVLTVGEAPGFAADGGVLNFKLDAGRVRFEINLDAARRAQLNISSKLLSLGQIVKTGNLR
jgi:hypothetical protein